MTKNGIGHRYDIRTKMVPGTHTTRRRNPGSNTLEFSGQRPFGPKRATPTVG